MNRRNDSPPSSSEIEALRAIVVTRTFILGYVGFWAILFAAWYGGHRVNAPAETPEQTILALAASELTGWAAFTMIAFFLGWILPTFRPRPSYWAILVLTSGFTLVLVRYLALWQLWPEMTWLMFLILLPRHLLIAVSSVGLGFAARTILREQIEGSAVADLELQLVKSRLDRLRMRLQPELVGACLGRLESLVQVDIDQADSVAIELSEFLRQTLQRMGKEVVGLDEEVAFADAYLRLRVACGSKEVNLHVHRAFPLAEHLVPTDSVLLLIAAHVGVSAQDFGANDIWLTPSATPQELRIEVSCRSVSQSDRLQDVEKQLAHNLAARFGPNSGVEVRLDAKSRRITTMRLPKGHTLVQAQSVPTAPGPAKEQPSA